MTRKSNKTGRSKGEIRHVRMHHWLMEKPAWKALKALERAIYLDIASRYDGSNNGRISYSVREAAIEMQITKSPAALAINNLEDAGFIICNTKGGFNRKNRHATVWLLTEFKDDVTGEIARKDFARWDGKFRERKPRDRTPKIQNTVLPAGRQVLPAGQNGAASRTIEGQIPPDSPASRTINTDSAPSSVLPAGHLYSTSGEKPQQTDRTVGEKHALRERRSTRLTPRRVLLKEFGLDPDLREKIDHLSKHKMKLAAEIHDQDGKEAARTFILEQSAPGVAT